MKILGIDPGFAIVGWGVLECVNGILYFGFDQTIMTTVSETISSAIANNSNFVVSGEGSVSQTDVNTAISETLSAYYNQEKYNCHRVVQCFCIRLHIVRS